MERLADGTPRYAKREISIGDSRWICYEDRKEHVWACHYGKQPKDISLGNGMSARISPPTVTLRGEGWEDDAKLTAFLSRVSKSIAEKGLQTM